MPTTPLLATKLYAPPVRGDAVARPRLVQRVEAGVATGHVVLAAPAGSGKSTLAAQWIATTTIPAAWLSLEQDDREPLRFLAYLSAALRLAEPGLGDGVERALRANRPPPQAVATELVNALAAGADDLAVVLDDYHLVDDGPLRELATFLVDHAPPRLHLVVTSRDEPRLPLARLRARGRLTELSSTDLRFGADEATRFLHDAMGLELAAEDDEALVRTTEGWAAGLQLAALSLRGRDDAHARVARFAGRHRHVLDYLSAEVLHGVDPAVRTFLLDVAILERFDASLCDAVTGRHDAAEMLERLERANLFLVRLDDERRWFRFHHLFADVLREEARRERGDDVAERHRRASRWWEARDATGEAIVHALAADDVERAARLLELAWRPMDRTFQVPTWDRWAARVPDEAQRRRPVLAMARAWSCLTVGEMVAAEGWLEDVEAWMRAHGEASSAGGSIEVDGDVADDVAFAAVPARTAAARAYLAQARGDMEAAEADLRRAVDLAPDDDPGVRALPAGLLGLGAWARGDLTAALRDLTTGMRGFRDQGDAAAALSFTFAIAEVQMDLGRLRDAVATYEDALRYARRQAGGTLPGETEVHVGLAEALLARGDADEAEVELRAGEALGPAGVLTGDEARLAAARARVTFALGDAEAALALLDEADAKAVPGPMPPVHPTGATRARIRLAQGRRAEARAWAEEQGPAAELAPSYVDAYAHLTVARVLLADFRADGGEGPIHDATDLLARIAVAAVDGGWQGIVLEARVLQALAHQAGGDDEAALDAILDALRIAEPEGHQAVFLHELPALAGLLRAAAQAGAGKHQVRRLQKAASAEARRPRVLPDFVEPLSERERDVLRLLSGDMSGPQIARELGMSVHTLRSHTKSIYAKFGVHGRREAVRRGAELGLG